MMKKKLFALLMAAAMLLPLTACGDSAAETAAPADSGAEATATAEPAGTRWWAIWRRTSPPRARR